MINSVVEPDDGIYQKREVMSVSKFKKEESEGEIEKGVG